VDRVVAGVVDGTSGGVRIVLYHLDKSHKVFRHVKNWKDLMLGPHSRRGGNGRCDHGRCCRKGRIPLA
jgi:hypothetical protein